MSGFGVYPEELHAAAGEYDEIAVMIGARLGALTAAVEQLLGTSWRGSAARSFGAGWDEWSAGAREAVGALAAMAEALQATGSTYAAAEAASVVRS